MGRSPSTSSEKHGLKKGPWTPEEDTKLIQYIEGHGAGNWRNLPKNAGLERCGKSCRLRWTNYLRPDIKRGRFSFDEEETIIQLHTLLGNKWSAIAARLPGRTDNEIKNYWNTHIRKRLLRSGIDPLTHAPAPRLDLLHMSPPHLTNLHTLIRLLNPDALTLAITLLSSSSNGADCSWLQNHILRAPPIPPNLFHDFYYNPSSTTSTSTPPINQQIPPNVNNNNFFQNQTQLFQENHLMPHTDTTNATTHHQTSLLPAHFCYGISDQTTADLSSENTTTFDQSINSNSSSDNKTHDFSFDSLMSTPLSSPSPTLAASSLINAAAGEDDTENFCTSLLRFEIQESWDLDDFL